MKATRRGFLATLTALVAGVALPKNLFGHREIEVTTVAPDSDFQGTIVYGDAVAIHPSGIYDLPSERLILPGTIVALDKDSRVVACGPKDAPIGVCIDSNDGVARVAIRTL
jgi:hypothetical protein